MLAFLLRVFRVFRDSDVPRVLREFRDSEMNVVFNGTLESQTHNPGNQKILKILVQTSINKPTKSNDHSDSVT